MRGSRQGEFKEEVSIKPLCCFEFPEQRLDLPCAGESGSSMLAMVGPVRTAVQGWVKRGCLELTFKALQYLGLAVHELAVFANFELYTSGTTQKILTANALFLRGMPLWLLAE